MLWKIIFIAVMAVGVLAEYKVTESQRQEFKNMLKETCTKNGAQDKTDEVEGAIRNFFDCVKTLFDAETLKKEIDDAKPLGALDEVFKKYCAKSPQLKTCIRTLTNSVTPCVDPKMREYIPDANNATDQLIDFVCYKDGDRIALFIAEGGPECITEKAESIRQCAMEIKEGVSSIDAAKSLTLDEQCAKFDKLSTCVVNALEQCSTPTPGNMAESLFRYVRNGSPCKKK